MGNYSWAKDSLELYMPETFRNPNGGGIFSLIYDKHNKEWGLRFKSDWFEEPPRLYGTIKKKGDHIYNTYKGGGTTVSALFLGLKGKLLPTYLNISKHA